MPENLIPTLEYGQVLPSELVRLCALIMGRLIYLHNIEKRITDAEFEERRNAVTALRAQYIVLVNAGDKATDVPELPNFMELIYGTEVGDSQC